MTVPCGCCPIPARASMCAAADLILPLTPAAGLVQVAAGASGGVSPRQWNVVNWNGTGIDADVFVFWTGTQPSFAAGGIGGGLGGTYRYFVQFNNGPHRLRNIDLQDLDNNAEQFYNFSPPISGVTGPGIFFGSCIGTGSPPPQCAGCGCVRGVGNNRNGTAVWPNTNSLTATWTVSLPGGFGIAVSRLIVADPTVVPVFACRSGTTLIWYDEAGNVVPAANVFVCN